MKLQILKYSLAALALLAATQGSVLASILVPVADLSVEKSDDPDPVGVGEDLIYRVGVTNNGPDTSPAVRISDTLPATVEFVSADAPCTHNGDALGGVVTCDIGMLPNGFARFVSITVRPTAAGTISNTARVMDAFGAFDPDPTDDTSGEDTTVTENPPNGATCNGQPATITGTEGNDRLAGTAGADVIAALGGNDFVTGGGGNDLICGGDGNDQLRGVSGNDSLFGEADDDRLLGGAGFDALNGGEGNDRAQGDGDDDTVDGEAGNDALLGNNGNDALDGGTDTDSLDGGSNTAPGDTCANGETNVNCESVL